MLSVKLLNPKLNYWLFSVSLARKLANKQNIALKVNLLNYVADIYKYILKVSQEEAEAEVQNSVNMNKDQRLYFFCLHPIPEVQVTETKSSPSSNQ